MELPVFISSTFVDFHLERDALLHDVRLQLNDALRAHGCEVEFIDLRWGVDDLSLTEDQRFERVLSVCLEEVRRASPLVLGLVGGRVGWKPPEAKARAAIALAGLDIDYHHQSVTMLELEAARYLNGGRAVVMLRSSGGDESSGWDDEDPTEVNNFRSTLEHDAAIVKATYRLGPRSADSGDLSEFVARSVELLLPELISRVENLGYDGDAYRSTVDQIIASHLATLVSRDHDTERIVDALRYGRRLCIVGASGSGKTAVVAAALTDPSLAECRVLPYLAEADDPSPYGFFSRLMQFMNYPTEPSKSSHEALRESLDRYARENSSVGIILDGLDRIGPGANVTVLEFLQATPPNVAVVVTTGDQTQAAALRLGGFAVRHLDDLSSEEMAEALDLHLRRHRRRLSESAVMRIVERSDSPLYLALACRTLSRLGRADFEVARNAADIDVLLDRRTAELPFGLPALIELHVKRAVMDDPSGKIESFMNLVSVSRFGLTVSDLADLLSLSALELAQVRHSLDGLVSQREGDRLVWTHEHIKSIAGPRDSVTEETLHRHLCEHHLSKLAIVASERSARLNRSGLLWHGLKSGEYVHTRRVLESADDSEVEPFMELVLDALHSVRQPDTQSHNIDDALSGLLTAGTAQFFTELLDRHLDQFELTRAQEILCRLDDITNSEGGLLRSLVLKVGADLFSNIGDSDQALQCYMDALEVLTGEGESPEIEKARMAIVMSMAGEYERAGDSASQLRSWRRLVDWLPRAGPIRHAKLLRGMALAGYVYSSVCAGVIESDVQASYQEAMEIANSLPESWAEWEWASLHFSIYNYCASVARKTTSEGVSNRRYVKQLLRQAGTIARTYLVQRPWDIRAVVALQFALTWEANFVFSMSRETSIDTEEAILLSSEIVEVASTRVAREGKSQGAMLELGSAHLQASQLLGRAGLVDQVVVHATKAVDVLSALAQTGPDRSVVLRRLAWASESAAEAYFQLRNIAAACSSIGQAIECYAELCGADSGADWEERLADAKKAMSQYRAGGPTST